MAEMLAQTIDTSKLTDRELLLILHERVTTISSDVREVKDGTASKLATLESKVEQLEKQKAPASEIDKLQNALDARDRQINRLNNYLWFAFGALAVLQLAMTLWLRFSPR
jgi:cell shape-determining protein MreC